MKKSRVLGLILGEIVVFFLAVSIVLTRYGIVEYEKQFNAHLLPLTVVLAIWLLIFFISNLYNYKALGNIIEITQGVIKSLVVGLSITILVFYIFSRFFELTPKVNLVGITILFGIFDIGWRYLLRRILLSKEQQKKVLIISTSKFANEIRKQTDDHPQIGYKISNIVNSITDEETISNIDIVVFDDQSLKNSGLTNTLYKLLPNGVEIISLTNFYEIIFSKIPAEEVEEEWFIKEIAKDKNFYERLKRIIELGTSSLMLLILSPLIVLISLLIKTTSRGPIIYKQKRSGKAEKDFTIYKFRTMQTGIDGPLWTTENDCRITTIGKFLRKTHFDEVPQLVNVIKGDLSFVGPRPERTELSRVYSQIPHYEIRHIIKPGIVGWAQLNYKPSSSTEEAKRKFEFDLYYIKNRSLVLDLFIILKTIKTIF